MNKVFQLGKSSLVITLPSKWVKATGIQKGDLINSAIESNSLILSVDNLKRKKEIEINFSEDVFDEQIEMKIVSAYVNEVTNLKLDISRVRKDLTKIIEDSINLCPSFEIVHLSSKEALIEFLGRSIEPSKIISKQKNQVIYLIEELTAKHDIKNFEKITDKMYYFAVRNILSSKKDVFRMLECASNFERICDILEHSLIEKFSINELIDLKLNVNKAYRIFLNKEKDENLTELFDKYYTMKKKSEKEYKSKNYKDYIKFDKLRQFYKLLCGIALF